jgi:membrane protease YdiL (CAAX protease family)
MSVRLLGKIAYAIVLTLWVVASVFVGQSLAALALTVLPGGINTSVLTTILAALGYLFALGLALGVPALIARKFVSKQTLGIQRLPSWKDIGASLLAVVPYYVASAAVLYVGMEIFNVIDPDVGQDIPFKDLTLRIEYIVAFITLVVIAPLAEELLFRGYLLGRLGEKLGKWIAVAMTAVVFGAMHLLGLTETGIVLQWGAAADTFAMGLVVGLLRVSTGSIWAGVLLHAMKNTVAFYFLFVNPLPPGGM